MSENRIQEWVKAAQSGEKAAWNVLYRKYYPGLYAVALQICNNIPVAQDMVQDAFMTAYLKLPQLKDVTAFSAWIKKIIVHSCYRASRRNQLNMCLDNIPQEGDRWWEDELNQKLEALSTQSSLYTALAHLPEVLRSTMLLRYFSAFQSYEEIAVILCIPVGTVRSRLNQAKLKLAEQWRQHNSADLKIFKQCEEWNSFYHTVLSGMHHHDDCKNQFMNHLQKDVKTILPGGKTNNSSTHFAKMIEDDREVGSWLTPVNVTSCGNISIAEVKHFNSIEHPTHCPPRSVLVLYRNNQKVNRMNFHISLQ